MSRKSVAATILAVVTTVAGLAVSLGAVSTGQEGIIIATTTAAIALGGLVAHAIHTGSIEPTAIKAAVLATVAQVVSLLVSFAVISNVAAGTVIAVSTAVVLAVAQVAHALLSRQA